jgi:hypothetical protein
LTAINQKKKRTDLEIRIAMVAPAVQELRSARLGCGLTVLAVLVGVQLLLFFAQLFRPDLHLMRDLSSRGRSALIQVRDLLSLPYQVLSDPMHESALELQ